MDDSSGQKRVHVKTDAGHIVDLDDQGQKIVVTSAGGNQITLDDGGARVTVETVGGQSITLEAGVIKRRAALLRSSRLRLSLTTVAIELSLSSKAPFISCEDTVLRTAPIFPLQGQTLSIADSSTTG